MTHEELQRNTELKNRWNTIDDPGGHHTENAFSHLLESGQERRVLNCAVPLARAMTLTDFQLPKGLEIQDCLTASVTGSFPSSLREWRYEPEIRSVPQLPQMVELPEEHASLYKLPWFQSEGQAEWLAINARHLRYHHRLWQEIKPKVLQGVTTTLVLGLPQIGYLSRCTLAHRLP